MPNPSPIASCSFRPTDIADREACNEIIDEAREDHAGESCRVETEPYDPYGSHLLVSLICEGRTASKP